MIKLRPPGSIFEIKGAIDNGVFRGRWHFSFDNYYDPEFVQFGNLRVFNDDILSKGSVWPLHPHREIEVISYCAGGEFRHADENGLGGVLTKGGVQHTTVGTGMFHSEINNRKDLDLRFIQMWFIPERPGLAPAVEQKNIPVIDRTDKFLPLVGGSSKDSLPIRSDAAVYSSHLTKGKTLKKSLEKGRGYYLCLLEGDSVTLNGNKLDEKGAAMISEELEIIVKCRNSVELLLVDAGPV